MPVNIHLKRGRRACRRGLRLLPGCLHLLGGDGPGSGDSGGRNSEKAARSCRVGTAPIPQNYPGGPPDWLDMFRHAYY
jgi:hypothetical protein